jgi:hypothetical protein
MNALGLISLVSTYPYKELERGKRGAKSSRFNMFHSGDAGLNAPFLGGFRVFRMTPK